MARPNGQIRRGQIINVFGPGALMDLPHHAAIVGVWTRGTGEATTVNGRSSNPVSSARLKRRWKIGRASCRERV